MNKIKRVFCALFRHSEIQDEFFGAFYCGRCGAQVGDQLASIYNAANIVIIGHKCDKCVENYKKMTFVDKFLVPNPFKENEDL